VNKKKQKNFIILGRQLFRPPGQCPAKPGIHDFCTGPTSCGLQSKFYPQMTQMSADEAETQSAFICVICG
jgi:hypothetical protein